jgi:hypothetical protein
LLKIGTAFVNKNDSLTVYLDELLVNGELHIRELKPKEASESAE